MNRQLGIDSDQDAIAEKLAQLDLSDGGDSSPLPADASTVRELKAELETLIGQLREPAGPDPFADESALRRAHELVCAIGMESGTSARIHPPDLRIGPYQILETLGEGGMGRVYKALHSSLEKIVALKVLPRERLHPEAIARFKREMKAVGKLDHPNIVRATDAGEADGAHFLVMEFVDGLDLSELLRRVGPLAPGPACELIRQAAIGLQHAHSRGLVHRDIKPNNLMLSFGDEYVPAVKILDMGLALLCDPVAHGDPTSSGQMMGTFEYMSPEQILDAHAVDHRSDVFSLGATLFKLLCGKSPLSGERCNTVGKMIVALTTHKIPSIGEERSDLPLGLVSIVDRMLAKDPAERFASAAEVAEALAPFAAGTDLRELVAAASEAGTATNIRVMPATAATSACFSSPSTSTHDGALDAGIKLVNSPAARTASPKATPSAIQPPISRSRYSRYLRRAAIALTAGLLVVAALVVYRIQTDRGVFVVTIEGSEAQAILEENGLIIRDKSTGRTWTIQVAQSQELPSGEFQLDGPKDLNLIVTDDSGVELRTDAFTLKRAGKVHAIVSLERVANENAIAAPSPAAPDRDDDYDADRRAAHWVLSIGGLVYFLENGQRRYIDSFDHVGDLPTAAFDLDFVYLYQNNKVTDAGLAHFKDCKNLTGLNLNGTQAGDAGLAHFANCNSLTDLHLESTLVTDAGLAYFKDCKNLKGLDLGGTQVSDAGFANFKDCKNLESLILRSSQVGELGLANFRECRNLTHLDLRSARNVTDAALANFKDCKQITFLDLAVTQVTDAGLAVFGDRDNITHLDLASTQVSDAGLAYFKNCKTLTFLNLENDRISDVGLANFQDCKDLTHLMLYFNVEVTDAGLAYFKDCKNLAHLSLAGTQVSDAGLAYFKDCQNLEWLNFDSTRVSDAGLAQFKDCQNIAKLWLSHTHVGDAGLASFRNCKQLNQFWVGDTQVSDAGLSLFKDCKGLLDLDVHNTQISDAALVDLVGLPNLTSVNLTNTRVSFRGVEQLRSAMPKCAIKWSETNRDVAESVLALGGDVEIADRRDSQPRLVRTAAELPRDAFQVRRLSLARVTKPLENLPGKLAWLRFPAFDQLENLDLSGQALEKYDFLANIHGLRQLTLIDAGLNDEALSKLPALPTLERLVLDGNEIRGQGLAHLAKQPKLIDLSLRCPSLTDLFSKNLAELKQLKRLSLAGSGLSDDGIQHLATLTNLESLDLRGVKVTAVGVAELATRLPGCKIDWDGTKD